MRNKKVEDHLYDLYDLLQATSKARKSAPWPAGKDWLKQSEENMKIMYEEYRKSLEKMKKS